jgi:hypothetical protein
MDKLLEKVFKESGTTGLIAVMSLVIAILAMLVLLHQS